jgi:hypothetical protein
MKEPLGRRPLTTSILVWSDGNSKEHLLVKNAIRLIEKSAGNFSAQLAPFFHKGKAKW